MDVGAITGQGAVTSITGSTSTASGTLTVGAYADVGEVTSLSLTSSAANLTFSTAANIGADSDGAEGESLATVTLSATNSEIDIGDGQIIYLDSVTDSTTDLTSTWTVTTAASGTVEVGGLDNTYGITTIDASENNGTGFTMDSITTASIGSITLGGSGTHNIGNITTTSTSAYTIDASDAAGAVTLVLTGTNSNATVNTGNGAATITAVGDTGKTTTISLGSGNETTDQIITTGTQGNIIIKNFETAAADDAIDLSNAGLETRGTGANTDALQDLSGDAITTDTVVLQSTTAASNLDVSGGNGNILIVGGDHATSALVETALETSGTHQITLDAGAAEEGITNWAIAWDDGTNTYLGVGSIETNSTDDTDGLSTDGQTITNIEITTILTLEGVDDVTDLVVANFGTAFIA